MAVAKTPDETTENKTQTSTSQTQSQNLKATTKTPLTVIGSDTAPLIFAHDILNFGVNGAVAHLLLCTRRDVAGPDGVSQRLLVTADLRIPVVDLPHFRDAIDKILLLISRPAGQSPS